MGNKVKKQGVFLPPDKKIATRTVAIFCSLIGLNGVGASAGLDTHDDCGLLRIDPLDALFCIVFIFQIGVLRRVDCKLRTTHTDEILSYYNSTLIHGFFQHILYKIQIFYFYLTTNFRKFPKITTTNFR